ncbi:unnamed protein product, partial [Meganyctiphanes norvegica]
GVLILIIAKMSPLIQTIHPRGDTRETNIPSNEKGIYTNLYIPGITLNTTVHPQTSYTTKTHTQKCGHTYSAFVIILSVLSLLGFLVVDDSVIIDTIYPHK